MVDPNFYRAFEDRYRGSRELIKSRLTVYLPFILPLKSCYESCKGIDLGCGRGEWLELMRESGIDIQGFDLDQGMLEAARERGLNVGFGDAIHCLQSIKAESQMIVTGFHLVEHLPFGQLQILIKESLRVLKPGGLLILETPNSENIVVGTSSFYIDPTHERPIPPLLLSFMTEYAGFEKNKILRLQESADNHQPLTLLNILNGVSPDYAVVAQKGGNPQITSALALAFQLDYGLSLEKLANNYDRQVKVREQFFETIAQQAQSAAQQAQSAAQQAQSAAQQAQSAAQYILSVATAMEQRALVAEAQVGSLISSNSWKLTLPLRLVGRGVRKLYAQIQAIHSKSKNIIRPILVKVNTFINHSPMLNKVAHAISKRFHALRRHKDLAAIIADYPARKISRSKMLYVDISDLVQKDLRTGIQRVTRSILKELLRNPPEGYQVEPVYATPLVVGYFHATKYSQMLAGRSGDNRMDARITPQEGDVFLGLDFVAGVVAAQHEYLQWAHDMGLRVYFVVYDLLPIQLPYAFPRGVKDGHVQWLNIIADFDGTVCISKAVQADLKVWLEENRRDRLPLHTIGWFHLGADIENSAPSKGMPNNSQAILDQLSLLPSFLMVGTIEPRKGHAQSLAAFEQLWAEGMQVNLVIVGKAGWVTSDLIQKLRQHPELNHRLFWLEGISDEFLEKIYAASTCLIAASEAEGFGLPLIEAAQHKKPIIARDIPVFREVAREHAMYYSGQAPSDLANCVTDWLKQYQQDAHPKSESMKYLSWQESALQLTKQINLGLSKGEVHE